MPASNVLKPLVQTLIQRQKKKHQDLKLANCFHLGLYVMTIAYMHMDVLTCPGPMAAGAGVLASLGECVAIA